MGDVDSRSFEVQSAFIRNSRSRNRSTDVLRVLFSQSATLNNELYVRIAHKLAAIICHYLSDYLSAALCVVS